MVNERNKSALVAEFETMLRRRLRSGAAPVAACAGFDLDAASAYLEGALGGSHRADYEFHLAGCASCRGHLIELARLAQSVPLAEAQPAAAPDRISAWGRWKESVAVWFDISSRGFKWRMAGATGAAFAILLTAFGLQSWRLVSKQVSKQAADSIAQSAAPIQAETAPTEIQTPAPEPLPQNVDTLTATNLIATHQNERSAVVAPAPQVGPQGYTPNVEVEPSTRFLAALSNLPGEAPGLTRPAPTAPETGQPPAAHQGAIADNAAMTDASRSVLIDTRNDSRELAARETKDPVKGLLPSPPPGLNPMEPQNPKPIPGHLGRTFISGRQAKPSPEPSSKSDKSPSRFKEVITTLVKAAPVRWPFSSDSESKPISDTEETLDSKSPNGMVWPFRGKTFVFDKGMWVDQEYKPEMQQWRRWTLTRGSELYKRVLEDEPQLKEFFDKGPILIVWKNRIYKVLK